MNDRSPLLDSATIEVGVGRSGAAGAFDAGAGAAIQALTSIGCLEISVVIVYASATHDLKEALRGIHSVVGDAPTIGTTTAGEIETGSHQHNIVVVILASPYLSVRYAVGHRVSTDWQAAVQAVLDAPELARALPEDLARHEYQTREGIAQFAMLFSPGSTQRASSTNYEILEAIKARTLGRIPIVGGASADDWQMQTNYVLTGQEAHADSMLLAIFETQLQFGIALTHGFSAASEVATVTAVEGHEVVSLDGLPAVDVLSRILGTTRKALAKKHITLTTGRAIGTADPMGQFSINVASYATRRGGVRFTQPLTAGARLVLMEPEPKTMASAGPDALRKAMLRGAIREPAIALVHHCALRLHIAPEASQIELRAMRELIPGAPVVGFHSFGEQGLADDGVSRHNNASVSALVLGKELSQAALVAIENQRLHREIERKTHSLVEANQALRQEAEERTRAVDLLQTLRDDLEARVDERTTALKATNLLLQTQVDERATKENALQEQNEFTEELVKSLPGLFYLIDEDGQMLRWNRKLEEVSGYTSEELAQTNAVELFAGDDKILIAARIAKGFEEGSSSANAALVTKAQRSVPHYFSGRRIVLDGKKYLISVGIDVSELKSAHEELRLAASVFETAAEAVMITDAEQRILAVNPAFSEITGYPRNAAIGKTPTLLSSSMHTPHFFKRMWHAINETGRWRGEITDRRMSGNTFSAWTSISAVKDANGNVTNYVGVFSDISERKKAEEQITQMAHHDSLTGLPNRILMEDRLRHEIDHAQRRGGSVALLFIDLDRFKNINDSLGHHVGDRVLQDVAKRIASCVRQSDTVCRFGGDEFLLILGRDTDVETAKQVAEKVMASVAGAYVCDGHQLHVTPSVGISIYPQDGLTPLELLRNADTAMYSSKESGRNVYRFFTQQMNDRVSERLRLENSLRSALQNDEFFLQYQPKVDLRSGRTVGVEALVRWRHPELGLIPPSQFIPLAEGCGLIVALGDWVLRTACAQLQTWQRKGLLISCAVNISAVQFHQRNFVESVAREMQATGLREGALELEVTEGIVMHHSEENVGRLKQLKQIGAHLAIDDFGTGYSSLSYLKRFPIDRIKIDQSFVRDLVTDPADEEIVKAIIVLAHSLNIRVVAEGVETGEQLGRLRAFGADEFQGFFFSGALAPERVELLL